MILHQASPMVFSTYLASVRPIANYDELLRIYAAYGSYSFRLRTTPVSYYECQDDPQRSLRTLLYCPTWAKDFQ
jgi:hypothetical protein